MQQNINQLISERDALQNEIVSQRRLFDAEIERRESVERESKRNQSSNRDNEFQQEIAQLRHQIVQLSAESSYNAQLANERDYFRHQLTEIQSQHEHEIQVLRHELSREQSIHTQHEHPLHLLNVDFSQQFSNECPRNEQFTQTDYAQIQESVETVLQPQAFVALNESFVPQFSASAMTRVVQEQKEILKACIEESVQMESYMSSGVEHLMSLNQELEQCAESIKSQVYVRFKR